MRFGVREHLLYIPAVLNGMAGERPDYLATVDLDPDSPTYSQIVHRLQMPETGDELHHMGWNSCSSCHGKSGVSTHAYLVAPGVLSGNIYFIDVKSQPREPTIYKVLKAKTLAEKVGVGLPHTAHCAPDAIIMSFMGGPGEEGFPSKGNGFVSIDPFNFEVIGRWERGDAKPDYGYDFWYQPRHNVMISSEWGEGQSFIHGFDPALVAEGKYGRKIYIWDFAEHRIIQELDMGVGSIPLEVRFLHDPTKAEGYVGCALSSEMVRFFKGPDGVWSSEVTVKIDPIPVEGWALPEMPALITDFVLSLDDRYLYLACWLHGDVRQYDISDKRQPRLVGQIFVGGSLKKGGSVRRTDGGEQPAPLVVKGVEVQGGAQMVQLSLDGKRLYVSTSLFSTWDKQFYPDMAKKGSQLLQFDVDTEKGGLQINPNFLVDFGQEPGGPALCHEMRLPGGDCTSDIWL
jgi:selenium-binding protein 1